MTFTGAMIVISVVKQTGLIDYLAIGAAKRARGNVLRASTGLLFGSAVLSDIVDNIP